MSSWSKALTNRGRQLQAKAQAGVQLVYTRMAVGSGTLSGQSLEDMSALITPVKDLAISRLKHPPGSTRALIGGTLTNQDVTTGFFLREVGIFANDPDAGEILYMYANAGTTADYITPSGEDPIEKAINMNVFVGKATNITANIDESLVYVTKPELDEAIAGITIPDASLTVKGKVRLSDAVNSTSDTEASTPKATKKAYDAAVAAQNAANAANSAAAAAQGTASAAQSAAAAAQSKADAASNAVGPLSSLLTSAKGNMVAAVNEVFQSGVDAKNRIVGALNSKFGVGASTNDTWAALADKIASINAVKGRMSMFGYGADYQNIPAWGYTRLYGYSQTTYYPPSNSEIRLDISSDSNGVDAYVYLQNPIDLTYINYIYFTAYHQYGSSGGSGATCRVVVDTVQQSDSNGVASATVQYHASGYYRAGLISVSNLSGNYYLRVHVKTSAGSGTLRINAMMLL